MRLLDLFCGGGGAAQGYANAGIMDIVGVDLTHQPRYPFDFVQADALEYLAEHHQEFDIIHASPPCQGYSIMHNLPWLRGREYPLLILPLQEMLEGIGKPYVIENVMGARHGAKGLIKRGLEAHGLKAGWLCGGMFGKPFYRHRLFAANWMWWAPGHPRHQWVTHEARGSNIAYPKLHRGALANYQNGAPANDVGIGHAKGWRLAAEAMGIDWMKRQELAQAIPPCYTEHIGKQWLTFGQA